MSQRETQSKKMAMDFASLQSLSEMLGEASVNDQNNVVTPVPQKVHSAADELFQTVVKTRNEDLETVVAKPKKDAKAIWKEEDVVDDLPRGADDEDGREQPEFEILYGQKITSQDCYLNMGFKDSSTTNCENLVVVITLPNTKFKDVVLDVTPKRLLCRSPNYKLCLDLPETVDSEEGSAKFITEKHQLRITLPIVDRKDQ